MLRVCCAQNTSEQHTGECSSREVVKDIKERDDGDHGGTSLEVNLVMNSFGNNAFITGNAPIPADLARLATRWPVQPVETAPPPPAQPACQSTLPVATAVLPSELDEASKRNDIGCAKRNIHHGSSCYGPQKNP
jgi:hypothetical protein